MADGGEYGDDTALLVVVLDLHPAAWGVPDNAQSPSPLGLSLNSFLQQFLIFMNSYALLNAHNEAAVIVCTGSSSTYAFPNPKEPDMNIWESLTERMQQEAARTTTTEDCDSEEGKGSTSGPSGNLTAGLSLALCYIHRRLRVRAGLEAVLKGEGSLAREKLRAGGARILVVNATGDTHMKYISFMNCVFSAQKLRVSIDSCCLSPLPSSFLQQAAAITDGAYVRVPRERQEGLLQYLLSVFLQDSHSRQHLKMPVLKQIDFRPSCFCHQRKVSVGHVCSVCLSVYCRRVGKSCPTCAAVYGATSAPGAKS